MFKFLAGLFGNEGDVTPVKTDDVLEYNDALEAQKRENARLETRIAIMREIQADLEQQQENLRDDNKALERKHRDELQAAEEATEDGIRAAKKEARESLIETEDKLEELKRELKRLESDKKISEREIEQMIQINDEKNALELEQKTLEIQKTADKKVQKIREDYQEKLEEIREEQISAGDERFEQLLARLPEVKGRIKGDL